MINAILSPAGYQNFADDIKLMIGKKPNIYFRATWIFFAPLILLVTF